MRPIHTRLGEYGLSRPKTHQVVMDLAGNALRPGPPRRFLEGGIERPEGGSWRTRFVNPS